MILFFIFLSLLLGILFKSSFLIIGLTSVIFFFLIYHRYKLKPLFICLGIFAFGFGISYISISSSDSKSEYSGIIYQVKDNYFLINSNGEKLYCYQKGHPYEIGDIVEINGKKEGFSFSHLESEFDFGKYLSSLGVNKSLAINKINVKFSNPIRLKAFRNHFLSFFDEETRVTVGAILFSDGDGNELTNSISSLHLSRLINAGGLYFHALTGLLTYFFSLKLKDKWSKAIALGISSFYLFLTFPRFSIIRLTFIYIFKWVNEYPLKKKFSYLEVLSICGVFFLLIDYHLAYQDGFILGFGIPIILLLFNGSFSYIKKWKKKLLSLIIIYLFFLPFELKYFNGLNPLLIIYQFILIPFFMLFFFLSILALYGLPIAKAINVYNKLLTYIVNPFTKISLEIYAPPMNDLIVFFYYLLFLGLLYYSSIRFIPIQKTLIGVFLSSLIIYLLPIDHLYSNEVTFVNVGQGDCCFIRKNNKTLFIDTGGLSYKDVATSSLIPFLKKKRVYDIDLVITTHDDYDHNGALTSLKDHFKVKQVMDNFSFKTTSFGNMTLTNYNNHISSSSEDNQKSLAIGFSLGGKDYLVTGDADKKIENYMMQEYKNIPCDILKVGHHGSKTSTSDVFIKWLKPEIGIISCGVNNRYGHPHQEVISVLKNNNVTIRRTDLEGSVSFISYFC